jgi:hypothetical protein
MNPNLLYACLEYAKPAEKTTRVLLTKLYSKESVTELVEFTDYIALKLPTVSSVDELKELDKRLRDIRQETIEKAARKTYYRTYDFPDRIGARDAAAILCFSLEKQTLSLSVHTVKQKIITDVLFVVSHAKTLGPRLRTHVWKSFSRRTCFHLQLSQWHTPPVWQTRRGH